MTVKLATKVMARSLPRDKEEGGIGLYKPVPKFTCIVTFAGCCRSGRNGKRIGKIIGFLEMADLTFCKQR